jgi:Arc/MetJ family transcription regulator
MTQVLVDDELLSRTQRASGSPTHEKAAAQALEEFVRRHEQLRVGELFGKIEYDPSYDYKEQRQRQ